MVKCPNLTILSSIGINLDLGLLLKLEMVPLVIFEQIFSFSNILFREEKIEQKIARKKNNNYKIISDLVMKK